MLDEIEQDKRKHAGLVRLMEERRAATLAALSRLRDEFGVDTLEAAEALLVKLKKKEKRAAEDDFAAKQEYKRLEAIHGDAVRRFLEGGDD